MLVVPVILSSSVLNNIIHGAPMRSPARVSVLVSLVASISACATSGSARGRDTISLPSLRVQLPTRPDSAWAVATAIRIFAGGASQRFEVLSFCADANGFLVDVTPAGPPRTLGGGGLVFISLSGTAVVLVPYQ